MNSGKKCDPKMVFFGTPQFGAYILESLIKVDFNFIGVVCQPDKPQGRSKQTMPCPVKKVALKYNISLLQPARIKNNDQLIDELIKLEPDLFIVASYGQIIPQSILDIPNMGSLNVHPSLLPKLRGASPLPSAILEGLNETGVTIMLMNANMDQGPILTQEKILLNPDETTVSLTKRILPRAANLLEQTICSYLNDQIKPRPQDDNQATYTKILKKTDGQINWSNNAVEIERQVRALVGWPGTFTNWLGKRLNILEVVLNDNNQPAGQIFKVGDSLVIGTGMNSLLIKKIQLEGKSVMSSADFLRGYRQILGQNLLNN